MRTIILLWLIALLPLYKLKAQLPQFAVVRPDGTTFICPTWDSAYNKALNGDYIYLPGATINSALIIDKRLYIFGAGHHPDSTIATGKTSVNASIQLMSNASGSNIEGIQFSGSIYLQYTTKKIRDITIKRCRFTDILFTNGATPADSLPSNITILENTFNTIYGYGSAGNSFIRNVIKFNASSVTGSNFLNNNFLCLGGQFSQLEYCLFANNIFLSTQPFANSSTCTDIFHNNLKLNNVPLLAGCPVNTGIELNSISVPAISDIFISYSTSGNGFPYTDNYHLKPACPGINAGTDGTDVGIYGTASPVSEGWVPSNPHIYYKQVAPQTNVNGQLQVEFRVRTNN